jgi:hypothetical protein
LKSSFEALLFSREVKTPIVVHHLQGSENIPIFIYSSALNMPIATIWVPILLVLGYYAVLVTHRLFFSPLSKIPGPWITRISGVLEANALKDKRRAQWATELFALYPGSVAIRTGPNSVSFNHPEAVKAIYGT